MLRIISSKVTYEFSSTQINFSPELSKRLKRWGYKNISASDVYKEEDSKGRETTSHVTIKYGLHTTNADDVKKVVAGFGPFTIELGKVSRFAPPGKPNDVVKVEVLGDQLHALHKLLGDELENSDEWDEYRPHATFAYIKKGTCRELSGDDEFVGEKIEVNEIVFNSSTSGSSIIKL